MLSHIICSLSFKMIYIVYLGQKRGGGGPGPPGPPPSKSATVIQKAYDVPAALYMNKECNLHSFNLNIIDIMSARVNVLRPFVGYVREAEKKKSKKNTHRNCVNIVLNTIYSYYVFHRMNNHL